MPRYVLQLSYRGTCYHGGQVQNDVTTVQETLQNACRTVLRSEVKVVGASRTDTGVHAWDQHATFVHEEIDTKKVWASLTGVLPDDISIRRVFTVPEEFNVIQNALSKVYVYRIWNTREPHPFLAPFVWHYPYKKIDAAIFTDVFTKYHGEHDFKAFAASDGEAKTSAHTIHECFVHQNGPYFEVWVHGNGFLKQMVRNLVGTAVDIATHKISMNVIEKAFASGDRQVTGICAPAPGLMLQKINYDKIQQIKELRAEQQRGGAFAVASAHEA